MPCIQRSLSTEDLYQRYHGASETQGQNSPGISAPPPPPSLFHTSQEETQGQNSTGISALPPPSSPPSIPRDFKALRAHRYRSISLQPVRQPLSLRLLDLSIFTDINLIPFDDQKMRIQNKLIYNSDYFLTNTFKITYIIARFREETSQYISIR